MYFFYVLKSKDDGTLYFGYTENLVERFKQHNSGKVYATKLKKPLLLVYYEAYFSQTEAKHREHSIKLRGNAYSQLKRRIRNCIAEAE